MGNWLFILGHAGLYAAFAFKKVACGGLRRKRRSREIRHHVAALECQEKENGNEDGNADAPGSGGDTMITGDLVRVSIRGSAVGGSLPVERCRREHGGS
jgi:hypothetical protein